MAIFHRSTNTPSKSEIVGPWLFDQPWCDVDGGEIELVGSFHLDDPEGEVGMQVFVVAAAGSQFQVPLTYRGTPVSALQPALIGEMEHSVLGRRYVYDGVHDEAFLSVLAGVTLAGYGQALGFSTHRGQRFSVPDEIRLHGHGAVDHPVRVDGFGQVSGTSDDPAIVTNGSVELQIVRRLDPTSNQPELGLAASWPDQATPVALVSARLLGQA